MSDMSHSLNVQITKLPFGGDFFFSYPPYYFEPWRNPPLLIPLCFCRPVGLSLSDITATRARRHVVFLQWAQEQGLWQSWGGIKTYTQMAALMWCQVSPWSATATRGGGGGGCVRTSASSGSCCGRGLQGGNRSSLFVSMGFVYIGAFVRLGWFLLHQVRVTQHAFR